MARKYNSISEIPENILKKLENYFTNVGGNTFAIHGLPPELTGGVLARYSRASTGLQLTLVNEFLDENGNPNQEKGSELMDRVLNAFGDESVGELEGVHIGIENVSQLLTKPIEDLRIGGSPIEKSTRYVKYDQKDEQGRWKYLRPREIEDGQLMNSFERINDSAFEIYSELIPKLAELFAGKFPMRRFPIKINRGGEEVLAYEKDLTDESEIRALRAAYNNTIKGAALDVGRCVLPASTLTNLGIYGNGRFFTNLLTSLKSSSLEEARTRGSDLETELNKVIPTFVKRNREISEWKNIDDEMEKQAWKLFKRSEGFERFAEPDEEAFPEDDRVTLVSSAPYLDQVVSSAIFPYTNVSLQQIQDLIQHVPHERKMDILNIYHGKREMRRDRTGRGLEAGYPIVFDLMGCFAEYRDLQRHRMVTQQRQKLSTQFGFIMPPEIEEVGLLKQVKEVVYEFEHLNSTMKHVGCEEASQYATLFNHRIRFMMGMNLREFQHLSELRTQPAGHFSYRSMVMEMTDKVVERDPWAREFLDFVDYSDPDNRISRAKEQSRIAGKELAKGLWQRDYVLPE